MNHVRTDIEGLGDQHIQIHSKQQPHQIQQQPQQTSLIRPLHLDKPEQIQFLNNVHFPERHFPRSQTQPGVISNAPADWQNLLPPNTSLADVLESRGLQMDWYRHLLNTAGIEIASRFRDLVLRSSRKQNPSPEVNRAMDDLFGDKSLPPFPFLNGLPPKAQVIFLVSILIGIIKGMNRGVDFEKNLIFFFYYFRCRLTV